MGRRVSGGPATAVAAAAVVLCALLLSGCGWFGSSSNGQSSTSVFDVKPGQCFMAPTKVKAELSDLNQVPCTKAHTQEAYALVDYRAASSSGQSPSAASDAYPGSDVLDKFAKGACAQRFRGYVGVDYLDSSLYYTYLLPSARSWEQDNDQTVICFVTTTGGTLTTSVKGSRK
jgi:hypothetical protein